MGQCFCRKVGVPPENVRDSFVMERGRKVRKSRISSPDTSVIGWCCFFLGKFRLLCT